MPVDSIMARGCICCVKYMLFLFNLLFWVMSRTHKVHTTSDVDICEISKTIINKSAGSVLSFLCVFQLGGCGLLGVGVWLSVSQGSFATLSPSFPSLSAANLIITLGTVVMVTGFLGCLGAIKENKCLLLSVSVLQYPSCTTTWCI